MSLLLIILGILLSIGIIFNGLGILGLLRFPDVYTRLHAATKCTTFGSIFTSSAVIFYGFVLWYLHGSVENLILAIHAIIALIALIITNPTGAHAIARATHKSGIMPKKAIVNKLLEEEKRNRK